MNFRRQPNIKGPQPRREKSGQKQNRGSSNIYLSLPWTRYLPLSKHPAKITFHILGSMLVRHAEFRCLTPDPNYITCNSANNTNVQDVISFTQALGTPNIRNVQTHVGNTRAAPFQYPSETVCLSHFSFNIPSHPGEAPYELRRN